MKKYHIYMWTNKVTKQSYIGYTSLGVMNRWKKHLLNAQQGGDTYFYRSIRKYGPISFECTILFETFDVDAAKLKEIFYINEFKTLAPNGYNSTIGGTGGDTTSCFDEHKKTVNKQKLSKATCGLNNPNAKKITDDEILKHAIMCFKKNNYWDTTEWKKVIYEFNIPKHFTSFRFSCFGGGYKGFKIALIEKLKSENLDFKCYKDTDEFKKKLSESMKDKKYMWVTDVKNKTTYLAQQHELNKPFIIKGRANYVNN